MPTDANGVYSLPPGYLATTGTPIVVTQHNPIFEDLASAITGRLPISGSAAMAGPLKGISGSVSNVSFAIGGLVNRGFFQTTNGIGVAVGGVQVAEFGAAGLISGARYIGELFAYAGSTAPPLCVLPVGQTLSRTTYAALWSLAITEISLGNTFFNNGNGTTTFGIANLQGRVLAARDIAGTVLSSATMSPNGLNIGATGGAELQTLTLGQVPAGITSSGTASSISVSTGAYTLPTISPGVISINQGGGAATFVLGTGAFAGNAPVTSTGSGSASVTSNNTGGAAHPNLQPTMIANYAMFAGA